MKAPPLDRKGTRGDAGNAVPARETFEYSPLLVRFPAPPRDVNFVNLVFLVEVQYEDVFGNEVHLEECRLNILPRQVEGDFYPCFDNFKIDHVLGK